MKARKIKNHEDILKLVLKEIPTDKLERIRKFLDTFQTYNKVDKLYKTYVIGVKKAIAYNGENKVYFEFKLDSTITGRLSCSAYSAGAKKNKGVSFHTLPRENKYADIRNLFIAPSGWRFICADYKTMELRILAHVADEPGLKEAFRNGQDIHTLSAQSAFNKEKVTKEERQQGKTISFTVAYVGGEFNIAETNNIPIERARQLLANYKKKFPKIFKYHDICKEIISRTEEISTIFGRTRHLPNVKSPIPPIREKAMRQGINSTIQGPASDVMTCAAIGIFNEIKEKKLSARLVATVHDSIEVVCSPEVEKEVCELVRRHMVTYPYLREKLGIEFSVPLEIDMEVGSSFGNGKEVHFDENGKVI